MEVLSSVIEFDDDPQMAVLKTCENLARKVAKDGYKAKVARDAKLDDFARYMNEVATAVRVSQGHLPATSASDGILRCLESKLAVASTTLDRYNSRNILTGTMRAKPEATKLNRLLLEIFGLVNQLAGAAAEHSAGASSPHQAKQPQQPQQPVEPQPQHPVEPQPQLPVEPQVLSKQEQRPQGALSALRAMARMKQTQAQQMVVGWRAEDAEALHNEAEPVVEEVTEVTEVMGEMAVGTVVDAARAIDDVMNSLTAILADLLVEK